MTLLNLYNTVRFNSENKLLVGLPFCLIGKRSIDCALNIRKYDVFISIGGQGLFNEKMKSLNF